MKVAAPLFCSLVLLLCPALVLAQAAAPGGASSAIQITSRIVYVDAVVRDSAGNIVHGLREKDFRIFENGKPQKITYFADHTHDLTAPPAAQPPAGELAFSNVGSVSSSVNIILFDFYNTAPQDQLYARKQMIRFLEALPPGKQTALFVLGTQLQMLQSFTGSTDRLVAAAKTMKLEASTVETTGEQQQESDFVGSLAAAIGPSPTGGRAGRDGLLLEQGEDLQQAVDVTGAALDELSEAVSGYPGRKNLYWLADRFPLYGGPALEIYDLSQALTRNTMNTQDMADANRAEANEQIAIYPISLMGLDASGMGPEAAGMTSTQQLFTARAAMHEMLNNLADTTGGRAYYGTNDFAGALRRGFEDGSSYYTLAYEPQNKNWNGDFRKIAIKLDQHGYSLSYRRGYYALRDQVSDQQAATAGPSAILNAALQPDSPELTMIRLHSTVQLPDAQHSSVRIDSVIAPANIDFSTDAQGRRHARLLVSLVAVPDADLDRQKTMQPNQKSGIYVVNLDAASFQKLLVSGMPMHQELQLAPGAYHLRLGVCDLGNNHVGTLDMPIQIAVSSNSHS